MSIASLINTWKKIKDIQQEIFNYLVLNVVYLIGIGLTAIFAKVIGKNFLTSHYKDSSWKKAGTTLPVEPEHMY